MNCSVCSPVAHSPAATPAVNDPKRMPGHWLLAKLGKRVLRPGGIGLTHRMLDHLHIQQADHVVEFAPGLGVTARLALEKNPARYTCIERDEDAATHLKTLLQGPNQTCHLGTAEETGLPEHTATVVYGEAMLTMHGDEQKQRIVAEAFRLLQPGGRYGVHELSLTPDHLPQETQKEISREISRNIHVGARPLTAAQWKELLTNAGFKIRSELTAPMHLLEPARLVRDEGILRALGFLMNVLRSGNARRRVLSMRKIFRKHSGNLAAISLIVEKP